MSTYPKRGSPMIKYWERYDTGELSIHRLKRWKHMPEMWWGGKIRRIMWVASHYKRESLLTNHKS